MELVKRKNCELLLARTANKTGVRINLGVTGNLLVDLGDLFADTGKATGAPALALLGQMLHSISIDKEPQGTKK